MRLDIFSQIEAVRIFSTLLSTDRKTNKQTKATYRSSLPELKNENWPLSKCPIGLHFTHQSFSLFFSLSDIICGLLCQETERKLQLQRLSFQLLQSQIVVLEIQVLKDQARRSKWKIFY